MILSIFLFDYNILTYIIMNKYINQIISYSTSKQWDNIINLLFDNKDNIIKEFDKYIQDTDNKDKLIEILVPYSASMYDLYIRDRKIIPLIRLAILHLIEQYYKLKLKEETEIKHPKSKITYVVTIADDEIKRKLFTLYLLVYYLEAEIRKNMENDPNNEINRKAHVGIDYEFNNRIIALMQINFETVADSNINTNSYIWLLNPNEFDEPSTKILIKYLMTNITIYKILQGPDSLDIPYMYDIMFKGDKENILKFTSKIFDTRFLCEYFRYSVGEDKKCSIYYALEYFGTISKKKYDELEDVYIRRGPIVDIEWNIHRMSRGDILYALYDVLFLQHYLVDIFNRIKKETPQYINTYKYIISLIRFIFIDRRNITDIIETSKATVNLINNYLIKHKDKKITLITIYNQIMENFKIEHEDIDFNFILTVGYLKKSMATLLKYIVYSVIQDNFKIYKNKKEIYDQKIDMNIIYSKLKKNRFYRIIKLVNLFTNEATKKILILYKK